MVTENNSTRKISLSEVKNILKKVSKEREEMLYEQRIALEHAQMFAKLPIKKTNDMIKELIELEFLGEANSYKIADLLPKSKDDLKTIFAKERITLGDNEVKAILDIVNKYHIE